MDYQRVIGFMQSYGLKVTHTYPDRLAVNVTGSVANIEQAFQVTMQVYRHPTENRTFYAPDVEPSVELGIPGAERRRSEHLQPSPPHAEASVPGPAGAQRSDRFRPKRSVSRQRYKNGIRREVRHWTAPAKPSD